MYKSTIMIHDIDTARKFVDDMVEFIDIKILLKSGDYAIDGHSIIGIISLDFSQPITLEASGEITENFKTAVEQYAI